MTPDMTNYPLLDTPTEEDLAAWEALEAEKAHQAAVEWEETLHFLETRRFLPVQEAPRLRPKWVLEGILPVGLTVVAADPKEGKSTVALAFAVRVAGVQTACLPPEWAVPKSSDNPRVLILSSEASPGDVRDIMERGLGADLSLLPEKCVWVTDEVIDWRLDEGLSREVLNGERAKKQGGKPPLLALLDTFKPRLVIIDPLANFHGLDENNSVEMVAMLRPYRNWAVANDAAVVVVHHARKAMSANRASPTGAGRVITIKGPDDIRGSSSMFGVADGAIILTRKNATQTYFNIITKRAAPEVRLVDLNLWSAS